jgi:hypothetical protein
VGADPVQNGGAAPRNGAAAARGIYCLLELIKYILFIGAVDEFIKYILFIGIKARGMVRVIAR